MASEDAILLKMRASRVQPHAFPHNLITIKQKRLAEKVANKEYLVGSGGIKNYAITYDSSMAAGRKAKTSASLVAAVMAKELVLQNRKVRCVTVPDLIRPNWLEEEAYRLGSGYLVVCDVGENTRAYAPYQWEDAQALLLSHMARGGGLIIGISAIVDEEKSIFLDFSSEMLDAFGDFEFVKVE